MNDVLRDPMATRDMRPRNAAGPIRRLALAPGAVLGMACVLAALLAALAVPAGAAWAAGGTVDIGADVAKLAEAPESGDVGELDIGAAVGYGLLEQGWGDTGMDGWLEIGCAVGLRVFDAGAVRVTFDAGRGSFEGDVGSFIERSVPKGSPVALPSPPRRAGWQFGGWHVAGAPQEGWDAEGSSALPLGDAWDFSRPVTEDLELHARWELRLDVTVPVGVVFAVNADTHEVTGPDAGTYAIKSRTVRPVEVTELAAESRQAELEGFFRLATEATPEQEMRAWRNALSRTWARLGPAEGDGADAVRVALATSRTEPVEDDQGRTWLVSHEFSAAERNAFTVPAFDYGRMPADDAWQGAERCERLPLAIELGISNNLAVRVDIAGAKPITHLKLTVSTRL